MNRETQSRKSILSMATVIIGKFFSPTGYDFAMQNVFSLIKFSLS